MDVPDAMLVLVLSVFDANTLARVDLVSQTFRVLVNQAAMVAARCRHNHISTSRSNETCLQLLRRLENEAHAHANQLEAAAAPTRRQYSAQEKLLAVHTYDEIWHDAAILDKAAALEADVRTAGIPHLSLSRWRSIRAQLEAAVSHLNIG